MQSNKQAVFFTLETSDSHGWKILYLGETSFILSEEERSCFIEDPLSFFSGVEHSLLQRAIENEEGYDSPFPFEFKGKTYQGYLILSPREKKVGETLWDGVLNFQSSEEKYDSLLVRTKILLEEVIKQSPVPIGILNPLGDIMMYNKAAVDVLGVDYNTSQGIGLNYFQLKRPWLFFDSEGRGISEEKLPVARALTTGERGSEEVRLIDAKGQERWINAGGAPIYDENGDLMAGLTVFPEITEQKITQQNLQERVRELDCLYNISHLAEQDYISIAELLHGTVNIILKSWKFDNMRSVRIVYDGEVFSGDVKDSLGGEPLFCQRCDMIVYGDVKGYIGISYDCQNPEDFQSESVSRELNLLNDISGRLSRSLEKKQSEKALQESEARFRSYIESAPDGIFLANSQGLFVDVNEAACRITGFSREELIGKPLADLTYPEDRELTRESFKRVKREGRTTNNCRFVRKDGEVRHWSVDAVQINEDSFLGFNRDITDEKKMEEQLRQMEKMDAIGQLAGGIAHDFNNQIGVIMGYSELLVSQLKDPRHLKFAKSILAGAHRSDDLTRKLLAFAHKGLYESKAVNLHKIIGEAVDILSHSMDRNISLKLSLKAKGSFTRGDPTQIQGILINLALNARDAMPDGGSLIFSTENVILDDEFCREIPYEVHAGEFVRVTVSDTGMGMKPEVISRIFEPFYTTKKVGKGTGMGLASVYGAMTNHKAVIHVESEPGEGTTFFLYFPLEATIVREKESYTAPKKTTEHASILLVDDDELIRAMGTEILEGLGYDVTACSNGITALEFLRENHKKTDLVILDMIMPGMGGKDVYRNIREMTDSLPVLISSGFSLSGDIQQLIDEGAAAFVSKPFEIGSFADAVSDVLMGNKKGSSIY